MLVGEFVRVRDWNVYTRASRARDAGAVAPGAASGRAAPLAMVHGLSISGEYMVPLAEALEDSFDVRIPDLPGFGRSDKPAQTLDVAGLADALHAWVEAVGWGRATFVANSLGCQVLVEYAARHPERAGPLVLVGPTMDPAMDLRHLVVNLLKDAAREDPRLVPVHLVDDVRAGVRRSWETFEAARRHDMEGALRRVRSPLLVVRGERDPLVSEEWARRVAELAGGECVELEGAPHAANYSAPEGLARVVRAFVARHEPPPPPQPPQPPHPPARGRAAAADPPSRRG